LTQVLSDGTNTYLYGNGRISQHTTQTEYFLGDALGSVRQLTNTAGAVTLTQSYAPYGDIVSSVGTSQTNYAFTGEMRDANGLTYLRARYLDSSTGRFTQRDPSGLESNLYLYAGANPVMNTDPSGYWFEQKEGYKTWAIQENGDTWFTLFDFLGIDYESIGYEGNFGEVPERYLISDPVVIIACGYGDGITCSHGTTASLDLYENLGDVKRVPVSEWVSGVKWGMASQIKNLMGSSKRGPVYLVGHSAGGDAVTASLSIITADDQKYKLGGVVIIDPTLTASVHEDIDDRCPGETDYLNYGDMAHILINSTLGNSRLVIYDSDQDFKADGTPIILSDFGFNAGSANYSYHFEPNISHLELAGTGPGGQKVYNFAMTMLQPSQWR